MDKAPVEASPDQDSPERAPGITAPLQETPPLTDMPVVPATQQGSLDEDSPDTDGSGQTQEIQEVSSDDRGQLVTGERVLIAGIVKKHAKRYLGIEAEIRHLRERLTECEVEKKGCIQQMTEEFEQEKGKLHRRLDEINGKLEDMQWKLLETEERLSGSAKVPPEFQAQLKQSKTKVIKLLDDKQVRVLLKKGSGGDLPSDYSAGVLEAIQERIQKLKVESESMSKLARQYHQPPQLIEEMDKHTINIEDVSDEIAIVQGEINKITEADINKKW